MPLQILPSRMCHLDNSHTDRRCSSLRSTRSCACRQDTAAALQLPPNNSSRRCTLCISCCHHDPGTYPRHIGHTSASARSPLWCLEHTCSDSLHPAGTQSQQGTGHNRPVKRHLLCGGSCRCCMLSVRLLPPDSVNRQDRRRWTSRHILIDTYHQHTTRTHSAHWPSHTIPGCTRSVHSHATSTSFQPGSRRKKSCHSRFDTCQPRKVRRWTLSDCLRLCLARIAQEQAHQLGTLNPLGMLRNRVGLSHRSCCESSQRHIADARLRPLHNTILLDKRRRLSDLVLPGTCPTHNWCTSRRSHSD